MALHRRIQSLSHPLFLHRLQLMQVAWRFPADPSLSIIFHRHTRDFSVEFIAIVGRRA
jgi:hypothetical protein